MYAGSEWHRRGNNSVLYPSARGSSILMNYAAPIGKAPELLHAHPLDMYHTHLLLGQRVLLAFLQKSISSQLHVGLHYCWLQ